MKVKITVQCPDCESKRIIHLHLEGKLPPFCTICGKMMEPVKVEEQPGKKGKQ
jgi:ribosomal protein S27E